jgi:hypothetical protein
MLFKARQLRNGTGLFRQVGMGVDVHGQPYVRMPREGLRYLRGYTSLG